MKTNFWYNPNVDADEQLPALPEVIIIGEE